MQAARGISRALQRGELREAHEGAKREPVAGGLVFGGGVGGGLFVGVLLRREDGADMQGAEGAGAEGAKRIKRRDDGVGVLKDEAAGGRESEDRAKSAVEGLDLDAAGAREGLRGLEREGQRGGEREVVGAGEGDGGRAGGLGALAEERHGRTRRGDDNRDGEGAAVVESDLCGEVVADLGGRYGCVGGQREAEGVGGLGGLGGVAGSGWQRTEVEVAEGEAFDLVEAEAGEEDGAVGGMELHRVDVRGLGEGAGGELVGLGLTVLLDGEVEVAGGDVLLERKGEREQVGLLGGGRGLEADVLGGVGAARLRGDGVDAGRTCGGDEELRGLAGDEWAVGAGVAVGNLPIAAGKLLQRNGGAGEGVEAPLALDGAGQADGLGLRFGGLRSSWPSEGLPSFPSAGRSWRTSWMGTWCSGLRWSTRPPW